MSKLLVNPTKLKGTLLVPPSKSDGQRALLCAALASGKSVLKHVGTSDDEQVMLQLIKELGKQVQVYADRIELDGEINPKKSSTLQVGESGLATRLIIGVIASFEGSHTIEGKGSILNRSLYFWLDVLPKFGVVVDAKEQFLPLTIHGCYQLNHGVVDGSQSSQNISGLLLGLANAGNGFEIQVENLVSVPYLKMTLETMKAFGIAVEKEGNLYSLKPGIRFKATQYTVESDWSSAAFWIVAGALGHQLVLTGLNPESLQADREILRIVTAAGAEVNWESSNLQIKAKKLEAFEADLTHCPDLFPIVALLASQSKGISKLKGVHRLKEKESDRSMAIQQEFEKMALNCTVEGDFMLIQGSNKPSGSRVYAHGDHRIAMMLGIAATLSTDGLEIDGAEHVAKSYPDFWRHLEVLSSSSHL